MEISMCSISLFSVSEMRDYDRFPEPPNDLNGHCWLRSHSIVAVVSNSSEYSRSIMWNMALALAFLPYHGVLLPICDPGHIGADTSPRI